MTRQGLQYRRHAIIRRFNANINCRLYHRLDDYRA